MASAVAIAKRLLAGPFGEKREQRELSEVSVPTYDPVEELSEDDLEQAMDILEHRKGESKAQRLARFNADVEGTRKQLALERTLRKPIIKYIIDNDDTARLIYLENKSTKDLKKIHERLKADVHRRFYSSSFNLGTAVTLGASRKDTRARDVSEASLLSTGGHRRLKCRRARALPRHSGHAQARSHPSGAVQHRGLNLDHRAPSARN